MRVIFRVDASLQMGTGHVMRCLTLAHALKENRADIEFICRKQEGNLIDKIRSNGFVVHELEILEEIDKRHEEIIEQFMEMAYTIKDEAREACMQQFEDDDDLPAKLKEINKENDLKRKNGLKELKKKLNDIIMDEELHCSAKLQKLYEDNEITEFI